MDLPKDEFVRSATLIRVIDGDTFRLSVDLGFGASIIHDVRLLGVDTPEVRGIERPAGEWVTRQVLGFIGDNKKFLLHSEVFSLGKYGRCLCRLWVDGKCLNNWLLDSGLAWPSDPSGCVIGVRSLDRLQLPDGIRRQCQELML